MAEAVEDSLEEEPKKKKKKGDGGLDPNAWMVTFSDLLTLMLTFFVLLLTMRSLDSQVIKTTFNLMYGGLGVLGSSDKTSFKEDMMFIIPTMKFDPIMVKRLLESTIPRDFFVEQGKMVKHPEKGTFDDSLGFKKGQDGSIDKKRVVEDLKPKKDLLKRFGIEVKGDERRVVITLNNRFFFEQGSIKLTKQAEKMLFAVGEKMKQGTANIKIIGHTDNIPVKSAEFSSNLQLSIYRAISVLKYLKNTSGIPANRLSAYGYGEHQPVAPNLTELNRARNRRIEIVVDQVDIPVEKDGTVVKEPKKKVRKLGDGSVILPKLPIVD